MREELAAWINFSGHPLEVLFVELSVMSRNELMDDCKELQRYGEKCEQHLKRVWLSHLLAMQAVRAETVIDPRYANLMLESFDQTPEDQPPKGDHPKLKNGFRELHLSALKAEYELHLKLICRVLNRPTDYLNGKGLRDLIAEHAGVDVDDFLSPQIRVAFALRNLIEHHNCKVDAKFADRVGQYWPQSTWRRRPIPPVGAKVPITEEDLDETYKALLRARRDLTEKLVSARRAARQQQSSFG